MRDGSLAVQFPAGGGASSGGVGHGRRQQAGGRHSGAGLRNCGRVADVFCGCQREGQPALRCVTCRRSASSQRPCPTAGRSARQAAGRGASSGDGGRRGNRQEGVTANQGEEWPTRPECVKPHRADGGIVEDYGRSLPLSPLSLLKLAHPFRRRPLVAPCIELGTKIFSSVWAQGRQS